MRSVRLSNDTRRRAERGRNPARRSGFVLLLVLALIVVAGLLSAGVARRSLLIALESAKAVDDLQERWARVSLQRCVLLQANTILAAEAARRPAEDASRNHFADLVIRLTDKEYALRIADEEAKANLNTIFYTQGESDVVRAVRSFVGENSTLPVMLRPFAVDDAAARLPVFDSWGQVFQFGAAQDPADVADRLMQATANLTCWGSGRVNVLRAPDNVATLVLRSLDQTGLMERLLDTRRDRGLRGLTELVEQSRRDRQNSEVAELVSLRSGCYSLWIRRRDGHSIHHEFHIAEQIDGNRRTDIMSFVW